MESVVDINFTLLVQIAHFIAAYFLLRIFLWKPIIKRLQAEEHHRTMLDDELQKQQLIADQKEFDLIGIKKQAQQAFALRVPRISTVFSPKRSSLEELKVQRPEISSEQVDRMVQVIVEKVSQG